MRKKKVEHRSNCPISTALDVLGDKWSLLIVRDIAFKGLHTYGEFLNSDEKIATNILADRLALLEMSGIIKKQTHPDSKAKILYTLTSKGIDLIPSLVEIIAWSDRYYNIHPDAKAFAKSVRKDREGVIRQLKSAVQK